MVTTVICGTEVKIYKVVKNYVEAAKGGRRFFSKVLDLTNPGQLARFPVPVTISLLLSMP